MTLYNTYPHFFYRQLFLSPSKPPSSLSLHGQTGLITGANTGLGYEAAAQLLSLGLTRLIMGVRSVSKGEAARQKLLKSLPNSGDPPVIEVWELDLATYSSITAFVDRIKQSAVNLDFAVLNAGVVQFEFELNEPTGNEQSIQINWLSTALLTVCLLPILDSQATAYPERRRPILSIIGSETAAWAKFREAQVATKQHTTLLQTLNDGKDFEGVERYYVSKLLYQLFFLELVHNHRSSNHRSNGTVLNLVNPGFCYGTDLHRGAEGIMGKIFGAIKRGIGRSVPMGARTLVYGAVVAGPESDGKYLSDNRVAPFAGYVTSSSGRIIQEKVWEETVIELGKVVDIKTLLSEI
ncbi:hypothetical protein BDV12DRAFT_177495 [Aspergillus spectabilis]